MSIPFSVAVKPSTIRNNRKPCGRRYDVITSELTMVPKHSRTALFPQLSKQRVSVADLHVQEVVEKQSRIADFDTPCFSNFKPRFEPSFLKNAYEMCRNICAEYAKTFYLGTLLMTEERQKAIWAIYGKNLKKKIETNIYDDLKLVFLLKLLFAVWCRRTDELVDGPNADYMSSAVLDRWEDRLNDIFNGQPYDMLDATLTDTISKFPLDIKVTTKTR